MKILFVQYWFDFYGGAETVNDTLIKQFKKDGYDSQILCLWNSGNNEIIKNIDYKKEVIGNKPYRASYKECLKKFKKLKTISALKDLFNNFKFYYIKHSHLSKFTKRINEINPDFIIVTNIDLIKYVPKKYLKKSVIHMHSGFDYYFEKGSANLLKMAKKYENKVCKLIWLTPNFKKCAEKAGFKNNEYMLNPVRFKTSKNNNLNSKIITFIGGFRSQKRVELLADIVNKLNNDYKLYLYGSGDKSKINVSDKVIIKGTTDDVEKVLLNSSVFALTSYYEGFPMVILEAYECGVPVIVYDFGPSTNECVINGKTGFIIKNNDEKEYIKKLKLLCEDNKLRKEMGKNAKKYASVYYPEIVSQRWYKLFKGEL